GERPAKAEARPGAARRGPGRARQVGLWQRILRQARPVGAGAPRAYQIARSTGRRREARGPWWYDRANGARTPLRRALARRRARGRQGPPRDVRSEPLGREAAEGGPLHAPRRAPHPGRRQAPPPRADRDRRRGPRWGRPRAPLP